MVECPGACFRSVKLAGAEGSETLLEYSVKGAGDGSSPLWLGKTCYYLLGLLGVAFFLRGLFFDWCLSNAATAAAFLFLSHVITSFFG